MRRRLGILVAALALCSSLGAAVAPTVHAAGVGAAPDCAKATPSKATYVPPKASAADKRASRITLTVTDRKNDQTALTTQCTAVARKKLTRTDLQSDLASVRYVLQRSGKNPGLTITYTITAPGVVFSPASQPSGHVVTQQFVTLLPDSGYQIVADNEGGSARAFANVSNGGSDFYDRNCDQAWTTGPWGGRKVTVWVPLACFQALQVSVSRLVASANIVDGSTVTTDTTAPTRPLPLTPR